MFCLALTGEELRKQKTKKLSYECGVTCNGCQTQDNGQPMLAGCQSLPSVRKTCNQHRARKTRDQWQSVLSAGKKGWLASLVGNQLFRDCFWSRVVLGKKKSLIVRTSDMMDLFIFPRKESYL